MGLGVHTVPQNTYISPQAIRKTLWNVCRHTEGEEKVV